jgi:hypothetical protein
MAVGKMPTCENDVMMAGIWRDTNVRNFLGACQGVTD